ncbi:FKBP-type peptidyl-prolyl cis-trans isomerase [Candidatus Saccharibacteria bacterium]|nr:FKBP-type peptidyl-prolyl cis-trans isomerase [Candidatus Saccharibacteria bacterium]
MLKGTTLSNYTPAGEVAELQKIDLVEGTGDIVQAGATVTVHYTGAYAANGEIFESSKDGGQPVTFPLANVIKGWTDGVPGIKTGGTRRLIIPGDQAYGVAPAGYTPGSTERPMGTLVFDIELISIN